MSDRARATSILQQAREILLRRLVDRVLESHEAILDDALGWSYSGQIEAIHDEIALRLNHVNSMLGSLPAEVAQGTTEIVSPEHSPDGISNRSNNNHSGEHAVTVTVIPGPHPELASEPASFAVLVRQIEAQDVHAAAGTLCELLEVPPQRAIECARWFAEKAATNPEFMLRAMQLRSELAQGQTSGALVLLWECFGLQGPESVSAMQTLLARMDHP